MIEHTFRSRWDSIINVKHGTPPGFVELGISHPQLSPRTVTLDPAIAAELGHALIGDAGRLNPPTKGEAPMGPSGASHEGRELSQLRAANDELQRRVDELQAQRHTHDQGDRHLSVDLSHAIEQRDEAQALWHEATADRERVGAELLAMRRQLIEAAAARDTVLATLSRVRQANEAGAEQVDQLTAALSAIQSDLHAAQSEAETVGQVLDRVTDAALQVVRELNEKAVEAVTTNMSWLLNPATRTAPRGEQLAWQATGAARVRTAISGVIEDARRDGLTWGGER